jgi:hypothetical protein
MGVGVGREVEHGLDCEFRSREEKTSGGEGQCEDGREAVSDGVVSAYFTDAFALEDVILVRVKAVTAWAVGFGGGVINWKAWFAFHADVKDPGGQSVGGAAAT